MKIGDLMNESGVKFGTSGARGLVEDMTDRVCWAYATGFLKHLRAQGGLPADGSVAIAGDLRPSSERIMAACARAALDLGLGVRNLGRIPSPAIAAFGMAEGMPSMMVTGSHIPDDRNGIKFNLTSGEILKADESGIRAQDVDFPSGLFDAAGTFAEGIDPGLPAAEASAFDSYVRRYLDFLPADALSGLRIGVYEHSSVAREPFYAVLDGLGAQVERLGWSDTFIPVDTEAIRPEDQKLAREWCAEGRFDALVSADGDGDRPLVSDAAGNWLRGDVAGVLCARWLGAKAVATPVSCNTVVEKSDWFERVERTRIGSPFVIEGMQALEQAGLTPVVGYEANGGFLTQSDIERDGRKLKALPTRDAVLVALALLAMAKEQGRSIAELADGLPARFTHSDRIKNFPTELSRERLGAFTSGDEAADRAAVDAVFAQAFGSAAGIDTTDGVRITFASGEIAHLRPSGNAPELRAYTEADSPERAAEMNRICLEVLAGWR